MHLPLLVIKLSCILYFELINSYFLSFLAVADLPMTKLGGAMLSGPCGPLVYLSLTRPPSPPETISPPAGKKLVQ